MANDYDLDDSDSFITYTDLASIQVNAYGGNDRVTARNSGVFTTANAVLNGGSGDDFLQALNRSTNGNAFANLDGEDGNDTLLSESFSTNGNADTTLKGGSGNDELVAKNRSVNGSASVFLDGGAGDDKITAENFSDGGTARAELFGRDGNDTLLAFNDQISGTAVSILRGGRGDDTYIIDSLNDIVIELAGQGIDTVRTTVQRYELPPHIENLIADARGQQLIGNASANRITGSAVNDVLDGGSGDDFLIGGGGFDFMEGGAGNDRYLVDANDTIVEEANQGRDEVLTSLGSYTLLENFEILTGTSRNGQTLTGNNENNLLRGGAGGDTFIGLAGNDVYIAGAGDKIRETADGGIDSVRTSAASFFLSSYVENLSGFGDVDQVLGGNALDNRISGFAGDDWLVGNGGRDVLTGGTGRDTFDFNKLADLTTDADTTDVITDFNGDTIDVSGIDANAIADGNNAFTFIGGRAFSGDAGELRVTTSGSRTIVTGDVDGDREADFAIVLTGTIRLSAGDFVL
jgi:Ca2+-binding RTX toxin-like protein